MRLTWKDVFNTSKHHWFYVGDALDAAKSCGYDFFTWNGHVIEVTTRERVGLERDLDGGKAA